MKKALKFGSPVLTIALFVLAGVLLLGSSIGGARAALTYYSETYSSQIEMRDIGVTLNENDIHVSSRDYEPYSDGEWAQVTGVLLKGLCSEDNPLKLGYTYKEEISATNSGNIDEYVRISLYTYWIDVVTVEDDEEDGEEDGKAVREVDGKKRTDLSPELINLHLNEAALNSDWLLDENATTDERRVLYYNKILKVDETTPAVTDTLTIDGSIAAKVTKTTVGNRVFTTYDYDGVKFVIEAVVDAVQTHNAEDAIWSAWGRRVSISEDGTLSLQ